jgi:phosphoribosyl 1,2-cyclic phosphate phosphodiesterase
VTDKAPLELTFLGTGTSFGVPVVGCACSVCTSSDPRDRRGRHGAFLRLPSGGELLVDTPPEIRLQLLAAGIHRMDAVWFTHAHADHIHGIDDLRIVSLREGRSVPVYVPREAVAQVIRRFDYIFDPDVGADRGTTPPQLHLHEIDPATPLSLLGETFHPLAVPHGSVHPLGFRVGGLGYVTDAKTLPGPVLERLQGVRILVLNALWHGDPHPNHFNVEEAVAAAEAVGAERTYLTHLTHRLGHAQLTGSLPRGIVPAHDGLRVRLHADGRVEDDAGGAFPRGAGPSPPTARDP